MTGIASRERGAGIVEFAIILPLLLLLILGIVDFGRYVSAQATVNEAARNAARYGSVVGTTVNSLPQYLDCDLIRVAGVNTVGVAGIEASDITIQYDEGPGTGTSATCPLSGSGPPETSIHDGHRISVTISTGFSLITPVISQFFGTVTLTATDRRVIFK